MLTERLRTSDAREVTPLPLSPTEAGIQPSAFAHLTRLQPLRNLWTLLKEWTLIFGAMWWCMKSHHPLAYVLTILWIGRRQFGLMVLLHDAVHSTLFPNRLANDLLSNWCCSLPVHVQMERYRYVHFLHHRFLGTRHDPDQWKLSRGVLGQPRAVTMRFLVLTLTGLVMLTPTFWESLRMHSRLSRHALSSRHARSAAWIRWEQPSFELLLITILSVTHLWTVYLLLWLVPMFTVMPFLTQLNALSEHYGTEATTRYSASRTTYPRGVEGLLTAYNVNYHLDHHLYTGVPWYHLRALHRLLLQHPAFASDAHITTGFFNTTSGVLTEITRPTRPATP